MKTETFTKSMMLFVGISGSFSVLCGAWLAHKGFTLPIDVQSRLETALNYQFIHTLALLATLIWYMVKPSRSILVALLLFCLGILGFSGSLYVKTFFDMTLVGGLTPTGGILLALAWLQLAYAGTKQ